MEVIIYIPGLAYDFFEQSVKSYAKRLMKAIDENEEDEAKTYSLDINQYEYGEDSVSSVATIYEHSADVKTERVRIYEY